MEKIGKKLSLMIGNLLLIPYLVACLFISKNNDTLSIAISFVLSFFAANAFSVLFIVPWAMLPEAIDAYFLKYRTKLDTLFFTFFIVGTKVLVAIYLGIDIFF